MGQNGIPEFKYHPEKGLGIQIPPEQLQGVLKQFMQMQKQPGGNPQQPGGQQPQISPQQAQQIMQQRQMQANAQRAQMQQPQSPQPGA